MIYKKERKKTMKSKTVEKISRTTGLKIIKRHRFRSWRDDHHQVTEKHSQIDKWLRRLSQIHKISCCGWCVCRWGEIKNVRGKRCNKRVAFKSFSRLVPAELWVEIVSTSSARFIKLPFEQRWMSFLVTLLKSWLWSKQCLPIADWWGLFEV